MSLKEVLERINLPVLLRGYGLRKGQRVKVENSATGPYDDLLLRGKVVGVVKDVGLKIELDTGPQETRAYITVRDKDVSRRITTVGD